MKGRVKGSRYKLVYSGCSALVDTILYNSREDAEKARNDLILAEYFKCEYPIHIEEIPKAKYLKDQEYIQTMLRGCKVIEMDDLPNYDKELEFKLSVGNLIDEPGMIREELKPVMRLVKKRLGL